MDKPDNKKIYDEMWADWVDMKKYGPASRWLRHLIKRQITRISDNEIVAGPIKTVLDVGSGEGTITNMIAELIPDAKIKGIDFSMDGVRCSKANYSRDNLEFIHDEDSVNMKKKYDLVTAFEVLEHIEDFEDFLKKVAAASDKYIMLSFPTGRMRPFEKNVGHFRNYRKGQVEEILEKHGFSVVKAYYAGFPFYNPLYREFCNITNSAGNSFTKGKYGWSQKTVGMFIYFLFDYLSTRSCFGDQFCGLFQKDKRS